MTISTTQQSVTVTKIGSVVITDTVEDEDDEGNTIYVREVRVYNEAAGSATMTLQFTLRLTGDTANAIELQAPMQTF